MRKRSKTAILTLTALVMCGQAFGQENVAVSPEEMRAIHVEVQRQLDSLPDCPGAGEAPAFRCATSAELAQLPDQELDAQVRWLFPELRNEALAHALQAAHQACATVALARYCPRDGSIVAALPINPRAIAAWRSAPVPGDAARAARSILQLALTYESVRGRLERSQHWSQRLLECRDEEAFRVLQTLVDGYAMNVTGQLAKRWQMENLMPMLSDRYGRIPELGADPERLAVVVAAVFKEKLAACSLGERFFAELEPSLQTRVFTQPPSSAAVVAQPERYRRGLLSGQSDLKTVLTGLENVPPAANWLSLQQAMTPNMVRQVAGLFGEGPRADSLLPGWEDGRMLIWSAPGGSGQVAISVTRFNSASAARAYHGFALDLQRRRDQLTGAACEQAGKVSDAHYEALELKPATSAVRCDKKLTFGKAPAVASCAFVVLIDTHVIEINWFGAAADTAWAQRIVDAVAESSGP